MSLYRRMHPRTLWYRRFMQDMMLYVIYHATWGNYFHDKRFRFLKLARTTSRLCCDLKPLRSQQQIVRFR